MSGNEVIEARIASLEEKIESFCERIDKNITDLYIKYHAIKEERAKCELEMTKALGKVQIEAFKRPSWLVTWILGGLMSLSCSLLILYLKK
ncbi:MAG: hypothetical protein AB1454_04175 [Candidatus Auribacterota bacterium]